jgi:hypothetical protein
MKKSILSLSLSTLLLVSGVSIMMSCEKKAKTEEQTPVSEEQEDEETVYACPMHPEITGKKGDVCSKCEMQLTKVEADDHDHEH